MNIILNHDSRTAETPQGTVHLTPREFDILDYLIGHSETCVSPEELYQYVWQAVPFECRPVIAVHIRHIREKIEHDPSRPEFVKRRWGRGYQFNNA
ncbi:MAG: winged helix-turn-helix domain-containing protein [Erysipelotrichaceae bacterium]|nr:winged helix-turn-helix transcriptional regulator [Solobacterium sp.]MCR5450307.1 winged helix-turn-helix domain-containing protein [Solobacterium sp.]MDO4192402.1 winged helix-turn-helix domain-containing protein [Erysipelotrichaceae bacterium]MDO5122863.1 winged helix-turn-helix domain-containing protein [Erysipelotrichaceae bacterium]